MRRRLSPSLALALLLLWAAPQMAALDAWKLFEQAKQYELKAVETVPKWASGEGLLFRLGWVSDLHVLENDNMELCLGALRQLRDGIKPRPIAVLVTGDNYANPPKGTPGETLGLRRHHALKALLKEGLGDDLPALVIPGDNFHHDFDKVFGADDYRVDIGGFRLIFAALDRHGRRDGCGVFEPETYQWFREQIAGAPQSPVLYIQHEPVLPPCFLDAPKLQQLFDASPQVLGALGGHLHLDLQCRRNHWRQWMAPSVGRSHRPGFKVLDFYADRIVALSYEWDAAGHLYRQVLKFQRITIPPELRAGLRPATAIRPQDICRRPARARVMDPALDQRLPELENLIKQYMLVFGVQQLLK